jgi:hypothetical protein
LGRNSTLVVHIANRDSAVAACLKKKGKLSGEMTLILFEAAVEFPPAGAPKRKA